MAQIHKGMYVIAVIGLSETVTSFSLNHEFQITL